MGALGSGFVLITCLQELKSPPAWIGTLALLPLAGGLCAWPLILAVRHWNYKSATIAFLLPARIVLVLMPLALWGLTGPATYAWLVSATAISVFISAAANPLANAWFKSIVPDSLLGRYIGLRTALGMAVMGLMTPLVGYGLNRMEAAHWMTSQKFSLLFVGALIFGLLDIVLLSRAEPGATPPRQPWQHMIAAVRALGRERRLWQVAGLMAGVESILGFATPYLLPVFYDLRLTKVQVAWITVLETLAAAAGYYLGGRWADRGQKRKILNISLIGRSGAYLAALSLILLDSSGRLNAPALFWGLVFIFGWINFLTGTAGMVYTKLLFQAVARPDIYAFAFVDFVKNCLLFPLNALVVGAGAWLISRGPVFELLGLPWHYAAILMGLSALGGALSFLMLTLRSANAVLWNIRAILAPKLVLKNGDRVI